MKLSKNFSRHEFACKCGCGFDTVDTKLLAALQDVRDHFGESVTINSAARCVQHNHNIGGSEGSQHLFAKACDIIVKKVEPIAVYKYLELKYPDTYGLGQYDDFTHLDVRSTKTRWDKRNKG